MFFSPHFGQFLVLLSLDLSGWTASSPCSTKHSAAFSVSDLCFMCVASVVFLADVFLAGIDFGFCSFLTISYYFSTETLFLGIADLPFFSTFFFSVFVISSSSCFSFSLTCASILVSLSRQSEMWLSSSVSSSSSASVCLICVRLCCCASWFCPCQSTDDVCEFKEMHSVNCSGICTDWMAGLSPHFLLISGVQYYCWLVWSGVAVFELL